MEQIFFSVPNLDIPEELVVKADSVYGVFGLDASSVIRFLLEWSLSDETLLSLVRDSIRGGHPQEPYNININAIRDDIVERRRNGMGTMRGKIVYHGNFKQPLDEFEEYM